MVDGGVEAADARHGGGAEAEGSILNGKPEAERVNWEW